MNPTQELFNRAVSRVIEQGAPGYNYNIEACALRTRDGHKCAVGMLINDEDYDPDLEDNASPSHDTDSKIRQMIARANPDLNLDPTNPGAPYWKMLSSLQEAHDAAAMETLNPEGFLTEFKAALSYVASRYDLEKF